MFKLLSFAIVRELLFVAASVLSGFVLLTSDAAFCVITEITLELPEAMPSFTARNPVIIIGLWF
jgi:hypothetical protein